MMRPNMICSALAFLRSSSHCRAKGKLPTSSTYSMTPHDHMSAALPSYSSVVSTCRPDTHTHTHLTLRAPHPPHTSENHLRHTQAASIWHATLIHTLTHSSSSHLSSQPHFHPGRKDLAVHAKDQGTRQVRERQVRRCYLCLNLSSGSFVVRK